MKMEDEDLELYKDLPFSRILIIEAFYGGSHKQLVDTICSNIKGCSLFTLPAKKWHWRARTSALYFAQAIPDSFFYNILFVSAVFNLAELIGLRPDLNKLKKVLYFHENQLVYPVRKQQERDFQYGYNQILSCLAADVIVFNSAFNMSSFLENISNFLKLMPDFRPSNLAEQIKPKCRVIYFPLSINAIDCDSSSDDTKINDSKENTNQMKSVPCIMKKPLEDKVDQPIHIVWPHRWEHDKDPDTFFQVLYTLAEDKIPFYVSVIGESFSEIPAIFFDAKMKLKKHLLNWGYMPSKQHYIEVLKSADIVVSTAKHEFYGVAMLEAVYCGCYPLCPNRLVYPELYPVEYLYNTSNQLYKRLKNFAQKPTYLRSIAVNVNVQQFEWDNLKEQYNELFSV